MGNISTFIQKLSIILLGGYIAFNSMIQAQIQNLYPNPPDKIISTIVQQGTVMTGIGNIDVPLLRTTIIVSGSNDNETLKEIRGKLVNTSNFNDIKRIKAYLAPDTYDLNTQNATLLGNTTVNSTGNFNIKLNNLCHLDNGNHYIWITADISDTAKEGNTVDLQINSYLRENGNTIYENNGNPEYFATIFLSESVVFHPGDNSSRYYRIPAITTAKDGSIVAVCDRRWNSETDLPNNIDIVTRRSTDNGKTWSEPTTIAGTLGKGGNYGHGDPAIVTCQNGDIIVLITAKNGFWDGTPDKPALIKKIVSHDNGITWDTPVDITSQIYGPNCLNPVTRQWKSLFISSGAFIQTRSGRLIAAMLVRDEGKGKHNYLLYSDDNGISWKVITEKAIHNGDEAKIIEQNNGNILISSRNPGNRLMNISNSNGTGWATQWKNNDIWGASCNGDMILYTSTIDGYNKNRLLHSIPWAEDRRNVSVLISYDEGKTWGYRKTICSKNSAYSALNILPDGTIGCLIEDQSIAGGYSMRFVCFSLEWLTDNTDTYTPSLICSKSYQ